MNCGGIAAATARASAATRLATDASSKSCSTLCSRKTRLPPPPGRGALLPSRGRPVERWLACQVSAPSRLPSSPLDLGQPRLDPPLLGEKAGSGKAVTLALPVVAHERTR